jgi:hypothetical protein
MMKMADAYPKKRGAILGVVLIVVLVVTTLGSGLISLNQADAVEVSKAISATQAFWAAEAGLERTRAIAGKNRIPFDQIPVFASGQMAGSIDGIPYTVTYPAPAGWNNQTSRVKRYDVTSTGVSPGGVNRQVMASAEIQTFASFMHASHIEGNVYFGGSDVLDGTVYVNDELNISGNPQFLTRVYTTETTVNYQALVRPDTFVDPMVFRDGLTFGAAPLDFTDRDRYVDAIETSARSGGLALDGDYRVVFNDNATVTYQEWERVRVRRGRRWVWVNQWGTPTTTDISSGNGALYVSGDATVSGEVNGSVTLAAGSDIMIEEDITYASATTPNHSDVGFNPDTITDALGLIARSSIEVTKRSEINIHGSLFVTHGGFGAAGRYERLGEPSINLFGGMTQYRRGIVGQLSWPPRGFSKNYRFDGRLLTRPPSQFPYSTFTITDWRQSG